MATQLLTDIEAFLAETGMSETHFGRLAANNSRLLKQLRRPRRNGEPARVWPETETEIRAFMLMRRREREKEAARSNREALREDRAA